MSISSFRAIGLFVTLCAQSVPTGAIYRADDGYAPLTSGMRAARVGDVLTVILVERTAATKTAGQTTARNGGIGLSPPGSGPFAILGAADLKFGGDQSFKGQGQAAQSNALNGEIAVTVTAVDPNGMLRVAGEKIVTLNRGDEFLRLTGRIRAVDIGPDNRIASTRIADARIGYTGKGEVARAARQGWLQRFFSAISPF